MESAERGRPSSGQWLILKPGKSSGNHTAKQFIGKPPGTIHMVV